MFSLLSMNQNDTFFDDSNHVLPNKNIKRNTVLDLQVSLIFHLMETAGFSYWWLRSICMLGLAEIYEENLASKTCGS